jgi:hypothetical protein
VIVTYVLLGMKALLLGYLLLAEKSLVSDWYIFKSWFYSYTNIDNYFNIDIEKFI